MRASDVPAEPVGADAAERNIPVARIHADGRVEHRTDPDWFTDYQRRETVEWEPQAEAAE